MMFINFQEKIEANFNEVKTELKEIESKIDGLSELLLDVSNMCQILYFFIKPTTHFKIY